MPTTRPRHQITETDEVAQALNRAALRWPNEPRSRLLLRLIHAANDVLEAQDAAAVRERLAAIDASSGSYSDAFGDGYLDQLREDWPE